jgi:hypothetical protein
LVSAHDSIPVDRLDAAIERLRRAGMTVPGILGPL